MTMTDTEAKALALGNAHAINRRSDLDDAKHTELRCALLDAVQSQAATEARHAAELREQAERFSEVAKVVHDAVPNYFIVGRDHGQRTIRDFLSPFIIAKPDPLVVEAREICARVCEGWTDIPNGRATAYRDGMHDDEADFAYVLNALRKANERPTHD